MLRGMMDQLMEGGGGGMQMGMMMGGHFNVQLRCFSAPFYSQYKENKVKEVNNSGKILLPASALDMLVRMNISYPMTFAIANPRNSKHTHVGVLEFVAEEGRCYAPAWVMEQLELQEESLVTVVYKSLPTATDAKFKPMSVDFLNISNPKAVLEMELRNFFCLTVGDRIPFVYNNQQYVVQVQDTKPNRAVTIVECNLNVEFDAPEGYVEPTYNMPAADVPAAASTAEQDPDELPMPPQVVTPAAPDAFQAFGGEGQRLDGKRRRAPDSQCSVGGRLATGTRSAAADTPIDAASSVMSEENEADGQPNFDYTPGTISFYRDYVRPERLVELRAEKAAREMAEMRERRAAAHRATAGPSTAANKEEIDSHFAKFSGKGKSLRS